MNLVDAYNKEKNKPLKDFIINIEGIDGEKFQIKSVEYTVLKERGPLFTQGSAVPRSFSRDVTFNCNITNVSKELLDSITKRE